MFPQVSPSLLALDFASLTTIAFCAPFVFMVLRIAFPATPLGSHLCKLPGGVGVKQGKPSAEFVQWTLTSVHSSTYKLLSFRKRVTRLFSVKSKLVGQSAGLGCPHESPMFRISLLPRRQNRSTAWQVAAYPAGCHNSPLHTKHLAARVCLARQLSPLLLGVTHGCTR
jgi:hypothetical protein